jgi:DNA polymerase
MRGDDAKYVRIYGGKCVENIVQALAALVIREQMAVIGERYKIAFQVHDEIVCVVPESCAEEANEYIQAVMSTPPQWAEDLPLACESGVAKCYGET